MQYPGDMWQGVKLHPLLLGLTTLPTEVDTAHTAKDEQENRIALRHASDEHDESSDHRPTSELSVEEDELRGRDAEVSEPQHRRHLPSVGARPTTEASVRALLSLTGAEFYGVFFFIFFVQIFNENSGILREPFKFVHYSGCLR